MTQGCSSLHVTSFKAGYELASDVEQFEVLSDDLLRVHLPQRFQGMPGWRRALE
jgi:hypothetical protein